MPISVTQHYGLDEDEFDKTEAFNSMIDWDTELFVDPSLLKICSTSEFSGSHDELLKYFTDTIRLIVSSNSSSDLTWKTAKKRLVFKELGCFGLGYSKQSVTGSGIGTGFANQLLEALKEITEKGVVEPELFELLGLFQEGVGCDRISDMTCFILRNRFASFTERVFQEAGYNGASVLWRFADKSYQIPAHPKKPSLPILLAPKSLLRDLPTSEDGVDLSSVFAANDAIRATLNQVLGVHWREEIKNFRKPSFHDLFLSHPEILAEAIDAYKKVSPKPYNYRSDPAGEYIWRELALKYSEKYPLALNLSESPTLEEVRQVVLSICDQFRENVEQNGAWEVLFDDEKKPRKERIAQKVFFVAADSYCIANKLDLSPESNSGRGPVDFKVSSGNIKVVVEIKLSKSNKLIENYKNQVQIYRESEKAQHAIYLVIKVTDDSPKLDELVKYEQSLVMKKEPHIPVFVIDGMPKLSASNVVS